jgi:hypothetical protein
MVRNVTRRNSEEIALTRDIPVLFSNEKIPGEWKALQKGGNPVFCMFWAASIEDYVEVVDLSDNLLDVYYRLCIDLRSSIHSLDYACLSTSIETYWEVEATENLMNSYYE